MFNLNVERENERIENIFNIYAKDINIPDSTGSCSLSSRAMPKVYRIICITSFLSVLSVVVLGQRKF